MTGFFLRTQSPGENKPLWQHQDKIIFIRRKKYIRKLDKGRKRNKNKNKSLLKQCNTTQKYSKMKQKIEEKTKNWDEDGVMRTR